MTGERGTVSKENMTLSLSQDAAALPPRMLTPTVLWKQSGVPRDLIYMAIHSKELTAYDMGSSKRPRFMVKPEDFQTWLNTRRVQGKK